MFAIERQKKIKQVLDEYKIVTVAGLSELLDVSEVTVRKDLEKLESEGYLTRTHGGATLVESDFEEMASTRVNTISCLEQKERIGAYAAEIVGEDEAIYLGAGTTCLKVADNLVHKRNLTIITNNVSAALVVMKNPMIKVMLTGGIIKDGKTVTLSGIQTVESLQSIHVDKAFVGVGGIDLARGFTALDPEDAIVNMTIRSCATDLIVVADSSKFNKRNFYPIGSLNFADKIISDAQVPKEYMEYCFENNVKLLITYDIHI